jgi:transcription-repair coupling factor (superfamily II helicase)
VEDSSPLADVLGALRSSEPYRALRQGAVDVERLPIPAAAWVLEALAEDLVRPTLILVPHEADGVAWVESADLLGDSAAYFSSPSLSPYQETDISLQIRAMESIALYRLLRGELRTVVCTPRALFRRLPTPDALQAAVIEIEEGGDTALDALIEHLSRFGYQRTDLVGEIGDFAVRGGVFDLFPPGLAGPVRLDLFGDTVESIRRFDAVDQRSLESLERLSIMPLSLFPAGEAESRRLADHLLEIPGATAGGAAAEAIEALRQRGRFPGWEHYLPLLESKTVGLEDWLQGALVVTVSPQVLTSEIQHHVQQLETDYRSHLERAMLAVPPAELERHRDEVEAIVESADVRIDDLSSTGAEFKVDFAGGLTDLFHGQLPRFPREIETARARHERLLMISPREHWPRLAQWCDQQNLPQGRGGVELVDGELRRGFRLPPAGVVVFGERQLFPRVTPGRPRARRRYGPFVSDLRDLRLGDFIVHADHGIGQYVGLRAVGGDEQAVDLPPALGTMRDASASADVEVMEVAYSDGRRLLLPLSRIDQIQRYSGIEGVAPRLDRLGGSSWMRTKEKVKRSMQRLAGDLVRLYAERQLATAPAMAADSDLLAQFEAAFDFEETEDQLTAVEAIKEDLAEQRPMDRLLCGDVGFGKTEVAMRAAFKAVDSGYQVAVLAPTTILADQHLETFTARFSDHPVRIEMISRRRSPSEIREIRQALADGKVDILIGTHRLLSRDVAIPNLGLLIVDEEQRFGVAQKERLRELKKNVHVLAMSATPVPRTLQLSLAGVRDLSVIETPPRDRMAVETAIVPFTPELLREAIEFERERQGQVYFVYNRVEGIEQFAAYLQEVIPDLRLTIGHGQLDENELAQRMHAFKAKEYDLLLATTIIENGIDIPNVNTIIVHRAERFGLAQLYQLRGRVGRSNQLAYCYLVVPADRVLTEEASQRLRALREFTELGAGFRVAARDLEIRGAGNLLGPEQSGHIAAVGIETYLKMLEDTVRELRGETVDEAPSAAIDLPLPQAIPEEYLSDANLRMELYRRIAAGELEEEEMVSELRDRFGPPPPQVYQLLRVAALKRRAEALRIQSISLSGARLQFRLRRDARVDVEHLVKLVSERAGMSFSPSGVLTVDRQADRPLGEHALEVLEQLAPSATGRDSPLEPPKR